jgi:hypothetical protein
MSAFYDQASLVVVPSGYKSGKIYAQKPLTTDGQLTFTRASTATRVNASGLIEAVASGVPRLDYLGSTCPKLLLEPQRTNSVTYSEQFDDGVWQKTAAGTAVAPVVTANHAISPDGTQNADLVVFNRGAGNTSSDFSWIYQNFATSAATYTISCYVKAATSADVGKNLAWRNFGGGDAWDVTLTNEWQRISVQATGVGATQEVGFYNRGTYTAANSVSVLMWGFQAEVGAYATSYVKTEAAAVTRLADMSGSTNYFGAQTFAGNFTFFVDLLPMEGNTGTGDAMILGGGDYNGGGNFQSYFRFASGTILLYGVSEALMISRSYTMNANQQYKILVTRTGTTVKIFVNGAQVGASATSSTSVILRSLGWSYIQTNYNYDGRINQVLLMPSGLTDAQAIELTTL